MKFCSSLVAVLLILSSCNPDTERSMYVWKTTINFNETDINFLKTNKITKLYIRFFDISVSENGTSFPKAPLKSNTKLGADFEIVPVIFIENESLAKISEDSVENLAKKIVSKTKFLAENELGLHQFTEIQLDCDWSKNTKQPFFKLIESVKKISKKKVSVTVRLHQLKYPEQTGVPPADCGVLMYYNMGQLKNPDEKNSILNNKTGQLYLKNTEKYPLELSLALPVYSWTVHVRAGKFLSILSNLHEKNVDSLKFLQKQSDNSYLVRSDTLFANTYFRYGDRLRLENVSISELERSKELCRKFTNHEIILFSYSPETNFLHHENVFNRIYKPD